MDLAAVRASRAERYPFEIGDRVKSQWELGRVIAVVPGERILVQFDEVDSVGWRRIERPVWRLVYTMQKVAQDTPMAQENQDSKDYWSGKAVATQRR